MRKLLILGVLITAVTALAAVVPRLSLERLVDQSEIIVHGRILNSRVAWNEKRNYIWTHYRVEVEDTLKSSGSREVVVSVPGGILDGVGMSISGATEMHILDGVGMSISGATVFEPGEEVVLFLYRTPVGYHRLTGWGQGKYSIVTDKAGAKRLRTNLGSITLADPIGKPSDTPRASSLSGLDGTSLTEFRARLRDMIRSGRNGGGR